MSLNYEKITGYLNEDLYTVMIIHRRILLRMRNVSNKVVGKSKKAFYIQ